MSKVCELAAQSYLGIEKITPSTDKSDGISSVMGHIVRKYLTRNHVPDFWCGEEN